MKRDSYTEEAMFNFLVEHFHELKDDPDHPFDIMGDMDVSSEANAWFIDSMGIGTGEHSYGRKITADNILEAEVTVSMRESMMSRLMRRTTPQQEQVHTERFVVSVKEKNFGNKKKTRYIKYESLPKTLVEALGEGSITIDMPYLIEEYAMLVKMDSL